LQLVLFVARAIIKIGKPKSDETWAQIYIYAKEAGAEWCQLSKN